MNRVIKINDIDDERVSIYTKYNEAQLLHYFEPNGGVFIAETPMVIERALDMGAELISFFVESGEESNEQVRKVIDRAGSDIDIYEAELSVIQNITGYNLTRGLLAAFKRPVAPKPEELLGKSRCVAVLEDVVNPTNLGAIFRSAAALGIDSILITSDSTDPFYRRAARVSMGTVFQIPWTYIPKGSDYVGMLHEHGFSVISMALVDNAISLKDPILKESRKRAIVFGNEGNGICKETLDRSDHVVIIPMYNGVDSLNVAASSAVAFWELVDKTTI
ncbi:MAG: RNA methyltransferase [Lachnospiraceae bacterium]|nr:RNA methyltransferase [Lachnospiraceae bacterium]